MDSRVEQLDLTVFSKIRERYLKRLPEPTEIVLNSHWESILESQFRYCSIDHSTGIKRYRGMRIIWALNLEMFEVIIA